MTVQELRDKYFEPDGTARRYPAHTSYILVTPADLRALLDLAAVGEQGEAMIARLNKAIASIGAVERVLADEDGTMKERITESILRHLGVPRAADGSAAGLPAAVQPASLMALDFIINGEEVPVDVEPGASLSAARSYALVALSSRSSGRTLFPASEWEMRQQDGKLVDASLKCVTFASGTRLFLTLAHGEVAVGAGTVSVPSEEKILTPGWAAAIEAIRRCGDGPNVFPHGNAYDRVADWLESRAAKKSVLRLGFLIYDIDKHQEKARFVNVPRRVDYIDADHSHSVIVNLYSKMIYFCGKWWPADVNFYDDEDKQDEA